MINIYIHGGIKSKILNLIAKFKGANYWKFCFKQIKLDKNDV